MERLTEYTSKRAVLLNLPGREATVRARSRALYHKALRDYTARVRDYPSTADGFPFSQEFRDYRFALRNFKNGQFGQ